MGECCLFVVFMTIILYLLSIKLQSSINAELLIKINWFYCITVTDERTQNILQ